MTGTIYQDWQEVKIYGGKKKSSNVPTPPKPKAPDTGDIDEKKLIYYSVDLANALIQARTAKNLSQRDLEKKFNLPLHTIANIENRTSVYNKNLYGKIMRSLGVDVKALNRP